MAAEVRDAQRLPQLVHELSLTLPSEVTEALELLAHVSPQTDASVHDAKPTPALIAQAESHGVKPTESRCTSFRSATELAPGSPLGLAASQPQPHTARRGPHGLEETPRNCEKRARPPILDHNSIVLATTIPSDFCSQINKSRPAPVAS